MLDPFIGSGTTALAAKALNRNYLGIDISQEYIDLCERRIVEDFDSYMKKAREWKKAGKAAPVTPVSEKDSPVCFENAYQMALAL